jgi:hypothetical protein
MSTIGTGQSTEAASLRMCLRLAFIVCTRIERGVDAPQILQATADGEAGRHELVVHNLVGVC